MVGVSKSDEALIIENEIWRLEHSNGAINALVLLGIVGLFFFIIPGIIFFIWATILFNSKKSKVASLGAQLASIENTRKKTYVDPLTTLKNKFIQGEITEEEYRRKKKLLKER